MIDINNKRNSHSTKNGYIHLENWLKEHLICPRDRNKLIHLENNTLVCARGHTYPIIDGIPVILLEEKPPTQKDVFNATFDTTKSSQRARKSYCRQDSLRYPRCSIDPYVQEVIAATSGRMYKRLINKLPRYPIPRLPLPGGDNKFFLEFGCNWGRWCIGASISGYNSIGIDHNLEAIQAARRVAQQLGIQVCYLVADARFIPFSENAFDVVFSYSMLQHFDKEDAKLCLSEVSRILKKAGVSMIQLPNIFGLRNLYIQLRRMFREPVEFDVRYWRPLEILRVFRQSIGPTSLMVDGFFSLNAQITDKDILPFWYRLLAIYSDRLKFTAEKINWLKYCADSLYAKSTK